MSGRQEGLSEAAVDDGWGGRAEARGNVDAGAGIRREARLADGATDSTARWPRVRNCAPILDHWAKDRRSGGDHDGPHRNPGFYRFGAP